MWLIVFVFCFLFLSHRFRLQYCWRGGEPAHSWRQQHLCNENYRWWSCTKGWKVASRRQTTNGECDSMQNCVYVYKVLASQHVAVLISSAQAAMTKYHDWVAYTTETYFLSVLESGKPKVAFLVLLYPCFAFCHLLAVSSHGFPMCSC